MRALGSEYLRSCFFCSLYYDQTVLFVFWKNSRIAKCPFEINWPFEQCCFKNEITTTNNFDPTQFWTVIILLILVLGETLNSGWDVLIYWKIILITFVTLNFKVRLKVRNGVKCSPLKTPKIKSYFLHVHPITNSETTKSNF